MKSIVAALCFLIAVAYCTAMLYEEQCRAPRPFASCDRSAPLRHVYYFSNSTNRCESDYTCAKGVNNFEDLICCITECRTEAPPAGKQEAGENINQRRAWLGTHSRCWVEESSDSVLRFCCIKL
uniref:Putative salivary kunitz domain protein n=1 Tax=Ixodes ricinus TaxID=34613 RepID=A0A0K8RBG3_IXORI